MSKIKKIIGFLILVGVGLSINLLSVQANSIDNISQESINVEYIYVNKGKLSQEEANTIIKEHDNENVRKSRKTYATVLYVMLSRNGNTNTVFTYMGWSGNIRVSNIRFNSLSLKNTSAINPKTYKTFGKQTRTATSEVLGSILIGTASIPKNVNRIKVTDSSLQIYSADHGSWISGVSGGTVNIN